eukprot:snap_masked-scaffold_57-processed-gene-0.36-mRNA-1 protein AED:1.00 eAED:1.00 QI:0/0/0/0/1/1/2/0/81
MFFSLKLYGFVLNTFIRLIELNSDYNFTYVSSSNGFYCLAFYFELIHLWTYLDVVRVPSLEYFIIELNPLFYIFSGIFSIQ